MALVGGVLPGRAVAPPEHAEFFFDRLAAASVVLASGVRRVMTDRRELVIPRLVGDVAANWTAEGTEITASDPNMDTITATPRKLAALSFMSNEVRDDSVPAVLELVGESMARALGLKLDLGMLEGTGTAPEIWGLKNQSGIQTVSMGTNGAQLTNLDAFADALGLLDAANAGDQRVIIMPPRNWTALSKIKEVSGSTKPVLQADTNPTGGIRRTLYGTPVLLTSQLALTETQGTATTTNSVYVYDTAQVVAVIRNDLTIETDTSVKFTSDQTAARGTIRADLVLPNPAAVVRIVGVLP